MEIATENLIRVFSLTAISFLVAILWTPVLAHFLYKYRIAKQIRQKTWDGEKAALFWKMHKDKSGTPTMGGLLVWVTAAVVTVTFNLSRSQTWLPVFVLVSSGALGFIDDFLNVRGIVRGLSAKIKFVFQFLIAGLGALWFFYKLEFSQIRIPGHQLFGFPEFIDIGWVYIPLFVLTLVFLTNAVNITDGLDGLAGGLIVIAFASFGAIAYMKGLLILTAFCGIIAGASLGFLWFNIPPAKVFMGDTGSLALGATLGVIAMLTNSVLILPFIGFIFVIETLSVILQLSSKKLFHRKIFLIAPLHHHLEQIGWPEQQVTMRLWMIGSIVAMLGLILGLIGMGL